DRGEAELESPDQDRIEDGDDADVAVDGQMPKHQRQELAVAKKFPHVREKRSALAVTLFGAPPVGQSQRPVSGTDSIRVSDSHVTAPEPRSVVDDAPGVQLAAILALDPYGPVVDGHTVGGYRPPPPAPPLKNYGPAPLK